MSPRPGDRKFQQTLATNGPGTENDSKRRSLRDRDQRMTANVSHYRLGVIE
ncbi:hypothetical protein DPMN_060393 [Dreissena polymorpha]|uniref:Uncharacterized protein n=1 Tax=Dreissena polymorpha TaxID=45954 RepID=A0A9D4C5T1_DREPO|nr:hypothetical protein DPMN_060393 [Dreissena polymorpha]